MKVAYGFSIGTKIGDFDQRQKSSPGRKSMPTFWQHISAVSDLLVLPAQKAITALTLTCL